MNNIKKLIQMLKEHQKPYIGHDYIFYDIKFCNPQVQMCIEALEKQMPKKPINQSWYFECPNCKSKNVINEGRSYRFCNNCGQRLDWSEVENE